MSIQQYEIESAGNHMICASPVDKGDYVKTKDHKAALAERDNWIAALEEAIVAAQWNNRHDDHKAALADKELAEADYERITTLQMAQNRRQEAELEKARELLKEVVEIARDNTLECFNEHMQNYGPRENMIQRNIDTSDQLHKEMNRIDEIAAYLGDKT